MISWWDGLTTASKVFAALAIPATAIMLIQTVLALIGVGVDTDIDGDGIPDVDVDSDRDALGLISIRGIVGFFAVGGWAGFVADSGELPAAISSLIALTAGTLALIGVAALFKLVYKLQGEGNLSVENAVGKSGKAYLPIPPKGRGQGKIIVLLQDRLTELDAVNEGDRIISTGESVLVTSLEDAQTVVVRAMNEKEKIKNNNGIGGISRWDLE